MQYSLVDKLHLLPVPETWWNTLSINFVVELSELSSHGIVIMVIDPVLKRVHFILIYTTVTMEEVARLFLYHIWKLHRLPR